VNGETDSDDEEAFYDDEEAFEAAANFFAFM
jgi:hypothetical protein